MFRRTFWFTAGAAAGVWATTKVNRKLRQLTPESLAAQAANKAIETGHRLKDFAVDVRAGMVQREAELEEVLGLEDAPGRELPAQRRLFAIESPDRHPGKNRTQSHPTIPYNRNEDH
ncbi:DUF6167 family protein [Streptomyces sp. NBC_01216]|uniref:DUF6167 family protein n=1 Tax=unclassified Streptomyces TaxID=2593676 RepID=UPI002E14FBB4|nr:DUF6167 family protein [Streptomyces sp. NBC_01216]